MWASFYLRNIALKFFFHWFALHFQDITYAKNSVFQAASFEDLFFFVIDQPHLLWKNEWSTWFQGMITSWKA